MLTLTLKISNICFLVQASESWHMNSSSDLTVSDWTVSEKLSLDQESSLHPSVNVVKIFCRFQSLMTGNMRNAVRGEWMSEMFAGGLREQIRVRASAMSVSQKIGPSNTRLFIEPSRTCGWILKVKLNPVFSLTVSANRTTLKAFILVRNDQCYTAGHCFPSGFIASLRIILMLILALEAQLTDYTAEIWCLLHTFFGYKLQKVA